MRLTDQRLEQLLKVAQEMHAENPRGPSEDLLLALYELKELREERRRQLATLLQRV